ncbi:MAG: glycosyltransferase family 2 protein [Verrucomicrobia bacterium]|nr:glycosyltransferase family 2 protein [Verrucomicrobiota bacterium]
MTAAKPQTAPTVSLGILAWNEQDAIGATLESIFRQSFFAEFARRGLSGEIICVANGCTDGTAAVAAKVFERQAQRHPWRETFQARVVELAERGKINAWNTFVHRLSAPAAQGLILMDGDVVLKHPDTLWNLYVTLLYHSEAAVTVDQPVKDIALKARSRAQERLSLATTAMTRTGAAQLSGQLYCLRAHLARNIYLPKDLLVEDGFLKAVLCTDFLTRPTRPERVRQAPGASHVFQAYVSLGDIFKNQKRQMMAQTITHLLIDRHLPGLSLEQRQHLGATLKAKDETDPMWLRTLIADHLRRVRRFWRLFPGLATFRLERWARLPAWQRLTHWPAAITGTLLTLAASWAAYRALKAGATHYWPDTKSQHLNWIPTRAAALDGAEPLILNHE